MSGRRTTVLLLAFALGFSLRADAQSQDLASLRQSVVQAGGRVIVTLKTGRSAAAIRAPGSPPVSAEELNSVQGRLETVYPVQVQAQLPLIGALVATMSSTDLARLAADSNVASIEPDVKTYLTWSVGHSVPTAARPSRIRADVVPWGVTDVGAPTAWAAGITGAGVKVGIMDTGIDYTHPDLNVVGGFDFNTSTSAPSAYNDNVASCGGHGTHVAGTVAAKQNGSGVVGVAPDASLYALKVFTDLGSGCFAYLSSQILALQWAVTNHLDVVSISIGNPTSPGFATAVLNTTTAGVVVVAAAGNSGAPGITYPAAAPTAIAVAALDQGNTVAGYSSSGPEMWIAAPGSGVLSTLPGGGTGTMSGTSMATPHVTGVVALIRQMHPTWTVAQVQAELKNDAIDISPAGFDNFSGWGVVQAPPTGSGGTPLTIAVSPSTRSVSVQQGNASPGDNATVTLSGTNSASTVWSATRKKAWLTLTTSSGTGSGSVTWTRNASGLAVGTYVDTITVSAAGATGSPSIVFDTLKITAAVVPVTIAVAPAARSVSVQQGNAAPSDNATITLAGTNAAATAWSATKKKAWLTLTTASGTGSGVVAWSRNTTGLAVGTYVDTITVSTAVTGSLTVFDTLTITTAPVALTIAISPAARSVSVQQGSVAPGDNAAVTLSGTNAGSTGWTATKKKWWTNLTTASGTGSGTVTWNRDANGLAAGTYVDTITVTAIGATGSPTVVYDTMKVTAGVAPLTVAVSPAVRSVIVQQGNSAPADNATVTLAGTNAGTTGWTATKKKWWTTLTTSSGTGSGTVTWTRNADAVPTGLYVDTITVTVAGATGSPTILIDTMKVVAGVAPLTIAVSPAARSVTVQQGTTATGDNASVTLSGTNAGSTAWSATRKQAWNTLTIASGTGSGTVAWTRNATGLTAGTYVDTITVSASGATGSPSTIYDTLKITTGAVPIALAVAPTSRHAFVQAGGVAPPDTMLVTLTGTNSQSTAWWAIKRRAWLTFATGTGTGNGVIAWTRNASGLAAGTYVDTITVASASAPSVTVYDTLTVSVAAIPVTIAVSPGARSVSVVQGAVSPGDNVAVTLAGTNAQATAWSATKTQGWLTLTNASGTGSGTLAWTRNASGLAAGTYVDAIVVTTAVTGAVTVFDTLKVTAAPVPLVVAVTPAARSVSVNQGSGAPGDNAAVSVTGTDAGNAGWTATASSARTQLASTNGTGSGTIVWNRNTSSLGAGIYVDTITVTLSNASAVARLFDTVRVVAVAPPTSTIAVAPHGRRVRSLRFAGSSSLVSVDADSALVQAVAADSLLAGGWSAVTSTPRIALLAPSGAMNQFVRWSRVEQPLEAGLYVDSVTVMLQADQAVRAVFVDSLEVVAVTAPIPDAAVGDLFDHTTLTDDQRATLDRQGNNNGRYDLGDFLAWVNRNHIRLSAAAALRMKQLPLGGN